MPNYAQRLQRVQAAMQLQQIDLLYLSRSANLGYLTGLHREAPNFGNTIYPGEWLTGAWIPQTGAPVLTVPRMLADFHLGDLPGVDLRVLPDAGDPAHFLEQVLQGFHLPPAPAVAMEDRAWSETVLRLQTLLPGLRLSLASALLGPLRRIKDEEELAILREAGRITELAYAATLPRLRHGMTTLDLTTEVIYQLKKHGATADSFTTSFYNMGPAFPFDFSNREAVMNLPLLAPVAISFDFGAVWQDYCYDYGRSVYFGEPDAEYRRCYELVMTSQAAGIAALKAGNRCEEADAIARAVIVEGGYGPAFRHRLGHGIGMDVHEPPFLTSGSSTVMESGMCFTVEPSITLPHRLSARTEDIVVVRAGGGEPLTSGFQSLHVVS